MTLTPEQIRALAPAPGYRLIDRYLPDPYRRALGDSRTPMGVVTKSWRDGLKRLDHELGLVQRSRSVAFFTDLDDGSKLGALHAQAPWEEEDTEAFRTRLAEIARLAAQGAASARRMLSLVGLATGAELVETIPPERASHSFSSGGMNLTVTTEEGQTRGYFRKPDTPGTDDAPDIPGELFPADVIDAPRRLFQQDARRLRGPNYMFRLNNTASASLPDLLGDGSREYPYPIFKLEAGENIGPLMLVQTFNDAPRRAPRAIVINRLLREGSVLDVETARMAWNHDAGNATFLGPWKLDGKKEALLAGLTEIATPASRFDNEPGDAAAGYALILRAKAGLSFDGALEDAMIDTGAIGPDPIQMPSLLGQGASLWRVLRILPDPDGSDEIHDARFEPLPSDADLTITARWSGRRAGEFAVVVDDRYLAPDGNGPLPHRLAWLDTMIDRFKLAGTVRVQPLAGELFAGQSTPAIEIDLASAATLDVTFDVDSWAEFAADATIADTLDIVVEVPLDFEDEVTLFDEVTLTNQGAVLGLDDALVVLDTVELIPPGNTAIDTGVRIEDSFDLTILDSNPRVPFDPRITFDPRILRGGGLLGGITPIAPVAPIAPGILREDDTQILTRRPVTINLSDRVRVRDRISIRRLRNR